MTWYTPNERVKIQKIIHPYLDNYNVEGALKALESSGIKSPDGSELTYAKVQARMSGLRAKLGFPPKYTKKKARKKTPRKTAKRVARFTTEDIGDILRGDIDNNLRVKIAQRLMEDL